VDLPVPVDDGAAAHLPGLVVPAGAGLPATDGGTVDLATLDGWSVVFCYPRTGRPGDDPLDPAWDAIPGARGCTQQTCSFRNQHGELTATGTRVLGVSTQSSDDQREAVERLRLPYPLLSDADGRLRRALRLPGLEVAGQLLLRRLTMVLRNGVIEHVRYPVFPPDTDAEQVLAWLRNRT
jgi:peroxiredoxin